MSEVSDICLKLRSLDLFNLYLKQFKKLGGKDSIVEIDESKFGKRKHNRSHRVDGVWVVGSVDRTTLRMVLSHGSKRDSGTLTKFCKDYIKPDSIIFSGCWRGYNSLSNYFKQHKTVNHSRSFVDQDSNVHTNTIERNWNGIKKTILIRCRTMKLFDIYVKGK
jgi:transposase-like protein